MALTAPAILADMLVEVYLVNIQVGGKVKGSKISGGERHLTFDPVWDKSMMSEEALLELNLF